MKLLLDQNLSPRTTAFLRKLGLEVKDVRDVGLWGATDQEIYDFAKSEGFILVTYDVDFSRRYMFDKGLPGLILLRVHPQTIEVLHPLLEDFFAKVSLQQLQSTIATIESHRYRLRKLR